MKIQGKKVLITGGSSGIGLALAMQLGSQGARLVITGRKEAQLKYALQALKEQAIDVQGVQGDVTNPGSREAAISLALQSFGGLDLLVNNAGAVAAGRLESLDDDAIRTMFETNLIAPVMLTRDALPLLRASGDALIVNISSGMGLLAFPFYSVYAASKAGIARFGESLRRELDGEGISVLNVFPVATDTSMMKTARVITPMETPDAVAEAIVEAILTRQRQVIRGDAQRQTMIALDRDNPEALDEMVRERKQGMEVATKAHRSL